MKRLLISSLSLGLALNASSQTTLFSENFETGGSPAGGSYSGTGVTGGIFEPVMAGVGTHTITYSYTNGNGCTDTAVDSILVDNCAGIADLNNERVLLYPNPTTNSFALSTDYLIEEVFIVDVNGRIVKTFEVQSIYDISELKDGLYIVHITINGTQLVKRVLLR